MKPLAKLSLTTLLLVLLSFRLQAALLDGLVSYWPMNTNDNGVSPDRSFSNNLVVNGGVTVAPGQASTSNAYVFNGTSGYLSISHAAANADTGLPIYAAGRYTICMWVMGINQTAKFIFTEGSTSSTSPLLLLQTGNTAGSNKKLDVLIRTDSGTTLLNHVVSAADVFTSPATWHHIAWVDDNG